MPMAAGAEGIVSGLGRGEVDSYEVTLEEICNQVNQDTNDILEGVSKDSYAVFARSPPEADDEAISGIASLRSQ